MPQIKILDRHKVTTIERNKADALAEQTAAEAMRKSPSKLIQKKKVLATAGDNIMKGFSAGERDLYNEVKKIQFKKDAFSRAELERT